MSIAIITGGSRGLGKSMALHLAAKGHGVILTFNSKKEEAEAVVAEIAQKGEPAVSLQLDVSDSSSFPAFATKVGQVLEEQWKRKDFDFLVNNAGTGDDCLIADLTEEQFDEMMKIHLKAPFFLTQKLLPLLKDGGRIVNISSGLARFSYPGHAAYGAMKGGVEVLTRYMAKEFGSRGITAIAVAPGPVETDFAGGRNRDNQEQKKALSAMVALGRVGLPDDIGGAVAQLLSEDCRWINGQRIEVSGGMLL